MLTGRGVDVAFLPAEPRQVGSRSGWSPSLSGGAKATSGTRGVLGVGGEGGPYCGRGLPFGVFGRMPSGTPDTPLRNDGNDR